jgi:hypothetical protein
MLVHIAYASTAAVPFDHQELLDLLSKVRERNAQLDITGLLLHQSGDFFQVIEGSQLAITQLLAEIGEDDRHRDVVKSKRSTNDASQSIFPGCEKRGSGMGQRTPAGIFDGNSAS